MTDETNAPAPADGEDTAAVLAMELGEKTYLEPKVETPEADTTPGDNAAAAAEQGEGEAKAQPKPKQTAQERIDELTRARREAERDRDFYKEQALRGTAPEKPAAQEAQTPAATDGEPDPATYEYGESDVRYIRAVARFEARQEANAATAERDAKAAGEAALRDFKVKAEKVATAHPDFYDVVGEQLEKVGPLLTLEMQMAVSESGEAAPEIAYHFATNPAEARRIAALSPIAQAVEIGKLATRFAETPKPTPKTATDAPEPAPQARGAGGQFQVAPDTNDFAAFDKQYRIPGSSA